MSILLDHTISSKKADLLTYFRKRAKEHSSELDKKYAEREYKKKAKALNPMIKQSRNNVISGIVQNAQKESWSNEDTLKALLMINYTSDVVMLETRNSIRPYEYMDFSRRIGEIWEPFCRLCFDYPIADIERFTPPLFIDFQRELEEEIYEYIDKLGITEQEKHELKSYYKKVWSLVDSGGIKLELDLHFKKEEVFYNIDFKSGFGSNEKGNTNRLLMVATIYTYLEENYECVLLVRSEEDLNNNYFQTLKNSGVWAAYCGTETYNKISDFTGFDLKTWINSNIKWKEDLNEKAMEHFQKTEIDKYLVW